VVKNEEIRARKNKERGLQFWIDYDSGNGSSAEISGQGRQYGPGRANDIAIQVGGMGKRTNRMRAGWKLDR